MNDYQRFLADKQRVDRPTGFDPGDLSDTKLFGFQRAIVRWACRRGRAAVWALFSEAQ